MECEDKGDRFEFEKRLCLYELKVWRYEAQNLFYSAEVLYRFESIKRLHLFEENPTFSSLFPSELTDLGIFNYRVQRMLWAYAFENLLKLIIVGKFRMENPEADEVPLSEIKSHNLTALAQKAGVELSEPESFYCDILKKCATWAGRYPLPLREQQIYDSRAALPSREALSERRRLAWGKYRRGEMARLECESDVLHSHIGNDEYSVYQQLKAKLMRAAKDIEALDER